MHTQIYIKDIIDYNFIKTNVTNQSTSEVDLTFIFEKPIIQLFHNRLINRVSRELLTGSDY